MVKSSKMKKGEGIISKIETEQIKKVGSRMDIKTISSLWINSVIKPRETFASEKKNSDLWMGVLYLTIGLVSAILINQILTLSFSLELLILGIVGGLITNLIFFGGVFSMSKILGGSGSFTQIFYLSSLFAVPLSIIVALSSFIPYIGGIFVIGVWVYELYLLTLVMKEVHTFDTLKAVVSWLIPLIVLIILYVLIIYLSTLSSEFY